MAMNAGTTFDPKVVAADFPVLQQEIGGRKVTYLDSAASSQRPRAVIDAMSHYYEADHANVHRGVYQLAERATAAYEAARATVARFMGTDDPAEIVFTKNATEASNLVARTWGAANLRPGDVVVLSEIEHHANLVPWLQLHERLGLELRYIHPDADGELDLSRLDEVLTGAKLLCVTAASNVLGTLPPVRELTDAARAHGAVSVVDAAQWAPHLTTRVDDFAADFVYMTGHKMLGPTGIGVLWGRRAVLEDIPPFMGGGEMILDVRLDGFTPNVVPHKFEAGTPPIAEAVGLAAAIRYLDALGLDAVRAHELDLLTYARSAIHDRLGDRITIHGPVSAERRTGLLSFTHSHAHPHDIAQVLDEHGVCVRAGHHCAKPLMRRLGLTASARASFYVYNDRDDVDTLVSALVAVDEMFG